MDAMILGMAYRVIHLDDSIESSRIRHPYEVSVYGNRLRRLAGPLVFQEDRRLHLPRPV